MKKLLLTPAKYHTSGVVTNASNAGFRIPALDVVSHAFSEDDVTTLLSLSDFHDSPTVWSVIGYRCRCCIQHMRAPSCRTLIEWS